MTGYDKCFIAVYTYNIKLKIIINKVFCHNCLRKYRCGARQNYEKLVIKSKFRVTLFKYNLLVNLNSWCILH